MRANNNPIVPIGMERHDLSEIIANQENQIRQMASLMGTMAESIRACTQQMNALAREVHMLTKCTPAQVKALGDEMKNRAEAMCKAYMCAGKDKQVVSAIRKSIRVSFGITSLRDLPRGDWQTAMTAIRTWDDYGVMKKLREELRRTTK